LFTDSYAPEAERTVREAVEAELDAFLFDKLARDQARHWEQHAAVRDPYQAALAMERQSRDRFCVLSGQLAKGPEREVGAELAEKGDGHVALLEAELGLMAGVAIWT